MSVVMPVFNGVRFIADAVRSVLASDLRDLELLVLDDGSTDGSVEQARRAANGDPRLRTIQLEHGGVAAARDVALHESRADLIANLDADDVMLPQRLTRQVEHLRRHLDCVAVGSRLLMIDGDGRPIRILGRCFTHEEIDGAHLEGRAGAMGNPTTTFRRAAAIAVGGYRGGLRTTGEDYDLFLRLAEVGRLENLPEVLTCYRVHGDNVSIAKSDPRERTAVRMDTLGRAFARRGISKTPQKVTAPPVTAAERYRDQALVRYFAGDRTRATLAALVACALDPAASASRAAARTVIFGGAPPRWSFP